MDVSDELHWNCIPCSFKWSNTKRKHIPKTWCSYHKNPNSSVFTLRIKRQAELVDRSCIGSLQISLDIFLST